MGRIARVYNPRIASAILMVWGDLLEFARILPTSSRTAPSDRPAVRSSGDVRGIDSGDPCPCAEFQAFEPRMFPVFGGTFWRSMQPHVTAECGILLRRLSCPATHSTPLVGLRFLSPHTSPSIGLAKFPQARRASWLRPAWRLLYPCCSYLVGDCRHD